MWVIGLSGVLSVFLIGRFAMGFDLIIGWQVGLYCLSIIVAPIIWFLYLLLAKWLFSFVTSSILGALALFFFGVVLAGVLVIAVPIWRLAVDPDQRAMIGCHYAAYIVLSPLLYLLVTSVRIFCFRPAGNPFWYCLFK